ncbi:MAG: hypothetical protein BWX92_00587 [Deltaproteobacteria bacterium ADurb.Bin135]|nr:MAG: hypothetical protein BWX92_00587 [Deltaproteobacteria bacterium ADurb.Bin135]
MGLTVDLPRMIIQMFTIALATALALFFNFRKQRANCNLKYKDHFEHVISIYLSKDFILNHP